jgi:TPP-dependent pyruvate/acetoin dehydrogenase alpha subunit
VRGAERVIQHKRMMAELCGQAAGLSLGRGGSMQWPDLQKGHLGGAKIIGGNIPAATSAPVWELMKMDSAVACNLTHGDSNTGNFRESLFLAWL